MKLKMNWAIGIVLAYVLFAGGTLGVVIFALGRPVDLVSADYYPRSLRQDQQMQAERNTLALHGGATIEQSGDRTVVVKVPAAHVFDARGTVTLYRASDASADRIIQLKTDADGRQQIPLAGLTAGLWSVQVRWTAQGREFYLERRVVAQ